MGWRPLGMVLFVGLCECALPGCGELRWPLDNGTLWHEPSAAVAPLPTESDAVARRGPSLANADAEATTKASGEPQKSSLESQFALGRLCERRGEQEQAERLYRAVLKKAPHDPRPYHRLGAMAVEKREFAQAEEHFRVALSVASPSADLLSDIGYCRYLQQQLKEAESTLNQALKLEPNHVAATNNLALVVGAEGRFDESLALFKRVNSEAKAYANLAYVLAQHGELQRSKEIYLRALTLDEKMRSGAALLQVEECRRTQIRLASTSGGPGSSAPATSDPNCEPTTSSAAPEVVNRDAESGGSSVAKTSAMIPPLPKGVITP